jgi:hypothetical protein
MLATSSRAGARPTAATPARPPALSRGARVQAAAATIVGRPAATPRALASRRSIRAAAAATAAAPAPTDDALRALAASDDANRPLRAVVYGGGLAGLACARVLAEHFAEVVLLERDPVSLSAPAAAAAEALAAAADPAAASARRGVPQYRQPHQLLQKGLEEIERLFPGATDDLYSRGAAEVAIPGGYLVYDDRMGKLQHSHAAARLVGSTRALLESVVRARLVAPLTAEEEEKAAGASAALPPRARVRVVPGAVVTGWVVDEAQGDQPPRVAGVRVRAAAAGGEGGADHASELPLRADLVVDASGRGSRAPEWLEAAGFAKPEVTTVSAGTVYLTATYRVPPSALPAPLNPDAGEGVADHEAIARYRAEGGGASKDGAPRQSGYGVMCYTSYPCTRSSILMPVENGLHQLICCAKLNDLPEDATTDAGVLAFADTLRDGGATARALRAAERVGEISTYRRTENFRRRYEQLAGEGEGPAVAVAAAGDAAAASSTRRWRGLPRGWVAIGDANVAFNPAYGQGISVGVLEALELGKLVGTALASGGGSSSSRSEAVAKVGAPFFSRALPSVVAVPWAIAAGTDAPFAPGFKQTAAEKAIAGYFESVIDLAGEDAATYDALVASMHLTAPPGALLHPSISLRVAWRGLKRSVARLLGRGGDGGGAASGASGSAASSGAAAR